LSDYDQTKRSLLTVAGDEPVDLLVSRLDPNGDADDTLAETAFDAIVFRLAASCLGSDPDDLSDEVGLLRASGLSAKTIAESLVPHVAQLLGERWCDDNLGFAHVTIACARLQRLLRTLGPDWYGSHTGEDTRLRILLVVPDGMNHTLGGLVLTGKLRRLGYDVRSIMGRDCQAIADVVTDWSFDLILISASGSESLDQITELVDIVRTASPSWTCIALGGTILEGADADGRRIRARTGADLVTNDLSEALRRCKKTKLQSVNTTVATLGPEGRG
jgi:methylmalonyl-CoA mutase cobalamin-binding subunit